MIDRAVFAMPGVRPVLLRVSALICCARLRWSVRRRVLRSPSRGSGGDPRFPPILGWIALFFLCFVGRQVLVAVQDRMLERYAAPARSIFAAICLARCFAGAGVGFRRSSAALCAAVIEGVEHVESYIALIIPKMLSVAIVPVVLLLAMLPLDWVSCLIALACFRSSSSTW